MSGYIVYWSKEYVKEIKKAGDKGPFKVVYGSQHTKMPYITSVKIGDIIYPVTIQNGTLVVMARLCVEKIEPAFEYTMRELGSRYSAILPTDTAYFSHGIYGLFVCLGTGKSGYIRNTLSEPIHEGCIAQEPFSDKIKRTFNEWECAEIPHNFTQRPITCCAEQAASGSGSMIFPREIPLEIVKTLTFGKTPKTEKPLKLNKSGNLTAISLSGFVRKMSEKTFTVFEELFKNT